MENAPKISRDKINISDSRDEEENALLLEKQATKENEKLFNVKLNKKANSDRDIGTHIDEELNLSGSDTVGYSEVAQLSEPISLDNREPSERNTNIRESEIDQEINKKSFSIKRATEEPPSRRSNINVETEIKPRSRSSTFHHKGREGTGDLGAGRHHASVGGPHIHVESFNVRFDESEVQRSHHSNFQTSESKELNIEFIDEVYIPSTVTNTVTQLYEHVPIVTQGSERNNAQNPIFRMESKNSAQSKKSVFEENIVVTIEEENVTDYKTNFQKCIVACNERFKIYKKSWLLCGKKKAIEIRNESYNTLIWLSKKELDPDDKIHVNIYNGLLKEIPHELTDFPKTLEEWRDFILTNSLDSDPNKGLLLVILELIFLKQKRNDVYGKFEALSFEEKKIFAILPITCKNIVVKYLDNWKFYQKLISGKPSNLFFTFFTNILNYYWKSLKKKGRNGMQINKKLNIKLSKNIDEFFTKN